MRVKDASGAVINGIVRVAGGGLAVNSAAEYDKYIKGKETVVKINRLEREVDQLKQLVHKLLESNNG